ncbi:MAG: ribonuclease HII, partial [Candidatus Saccharimonadales bacterium]
MIGVDEVGRGAWAGPLLVVAARLKKNRDLPAGLTDSKLLTKIQKEQFYQQLLILCDFGEGWVAVEEVDSLGLTAALKIGCMRAVGALGSVENEDICIDGNINYLKDVYEKS